MYTIDNKFLILKPEKMKKIMIIMYFMPVLVWYVNHSNV